MQNCYNTGERVPREKQFDQDERLTNKHIQTLQFVQEVVRENKELKLKLEEYQEVVRENKELKSKLEEYQLNESKCAELHALAEESQEKIKMIQEQYMKRADEINAMMAEKHRDEMMKVVNEKLDQERQYSENIVQLRSEITQLEKKNGELVERIKQLTESQDRIEVLNAEIEDSKREISDLRIEVEALRAENEQLSGEKHSQFSQIQSLQTMKQQNESLAQDLKAMAHKNMELQHKITHLEADLKEATAAREQIDLIDNLKNKLSKLHKEKSIMAEKEDFYQKHIGDLKYEIERLTERIQNAEVTKDRVLEEYHRVHAELQYLKKHQSGDSKNANFKDYVRLKREVALLKEENLELRRTGNGKHLGASSSTASLPMLRFEPDTPVVKMSADKKSVKSKKQLVIAAK